MRTASLWHFNCNLHSPSPLPLSLTEASLHMRVAKKSGLPDPSTPNQGLHISSGGTGHQHFSLPQLQVEKAKFLVGVLQKPVLRFISPAGPEEFTLQALGPEQRVRVFNTRTGMIKRVCGFAGAGQFKDQDKGDKLQLLVL